MSNTPSSRPEEELYELLEVVPAMFKLARKGRL